MWYAVETAFVDGKHFASRPCFELDTDPDPRRAKAGICYCGHDEMPHNSSQKFMDGRIEIHVDWFQTKEQAMKFCDGSLTYIMHYDVEYRRNINSHIPHFRKWEAVDTSEGRPPFRGICEKHETR